MFVEGFTQRFRVDVRTKTEVQRIDRERREVVARDLRTGSTYTESYDKLVLSPGAEPLKPPIPGVDLEGIFTLRSVPDADRIKRFVQTERPNRAVIIGAGFIGLEMAENLHRRGIFVTLVEMAEQVMTPLDYEMAAEVHEHLKTKDVELYLQDGVASFRRAGEKLVVTLASGKALVADMAILSIGVRPESTLAREAGLQLGDRGGIVVDRYLRTSDPSIYAIGDAIVFENPIINKPMMAYLAGPANKQARIVADNVSGGDRKEYRGAIGTAIARVFDLTVASTGVSEKTLEQYGIPFHSSITHSASHAGYYPGAHPMSVKIVFAPGDGKLLGAQIVGYQGVDKRIDILASVLKSGGTVHDLADMEHAYAPPYSSARDPVNVAGFVAENIIDDLMNIVHWHHIVEGDLGDHVLLDVRTPEEYRNGTVVGAVNIPIDELRERVVELPRDRKIVVFCEVGLRAYLAVRILAQHGFQDLYNLSGGYKTYQYVSQKQSNEDIFERDYNGRDDNIHQAEKAAS